MAQPILQNRSATLRHQWTDGNGEPAAPNAGLTVAVHDIDGTELVATTATGVTPGDANTASTYALDVAHTPNLGRLTVTWTSLTETATQPVDVVGAMFGSVAALTAAEPKLTAGSGAKTSDELRDLRDEMWWFLEDRIGYSLVPRRTKATLNVRAEHSIELPDLYVNEITSITEDGTAVALTDVRLVKLAGMVTRIDRPWTPNVPIVIDYLHGLEEVPPDLLSAAWTGCLAIGTDNTGPRPIGVTSWNDPASGANFRSLVPGRGDTPTVIPELNEQIFALRLRRAI